MKKIISTFIIISALAFFHQAQAQLVVTGGALNGTNLAQNLAGNNITVTNASVSGNASQSGTFTFSGAGLNVNSGVIMSTGSIFDAVGPNTNGSTSTVFNGPGNTLLSNLSGQTTRDAVVLQFDFEVQSEDIEFNYIFLSEEYNEWVGSSFNDVFAFYISGPGIVGEENLAVVPGTTTPVSINTINSSSFWQYYVDNESAPFTSNIEYDGFTTLMTASKSGLIPCETYTLKLMIADAGDAALDAAVLLQENSLVQSNVSATSYTYSSNNTALEGCIQASFTFEIDSALSQNTSIPIQIGGSATNGVDYAFIDSIIIIPAGQTSATIIIDSYTDGITEGQESVELYFYPRPCEAPDTVFLYIDDNQPIEFSLNGTDLDCAGDSSGIIDVTITGGSPPYQVTLTDTVIGNSISYPSSALPINNLPASTYQIEVSDQYGCSAEALVVGGDFDAGTTFLPDGNGVSYSSDIVISGFNAGQTLTSEQQINSICALMEHSYANDLTIELEAPNGSTVMLKNVGPTGGTYDACNMGEPVASGPVDNWNASNTTPGVGYNYCWTNTPVYGTMGSEIQSGSVPYYTYTSTWGNILSDYYLPAGSYSPVQNLSGFIGTTLNGTWSLNITDNYSKDNGYIFEWSISLTSDLPDSTITLIEPDSINVSGGVTNAACGSNDGAIDITVSGDYPPFGFNWSNGATSEDISGLSAGTYTVTVHDASTCEVTMTFNIPNGASVAMTSSITDETCYNSFDGAIDITMTNGTTPFSYLWSNGDTIEDISSLSDGTYTVTVTDDNGCISIGNYTVNDPNPIVNTATITNENCGDAEGIIALSTSGGTSTYTYLWSTGETTATIDELSAGTYHVTVYDINLCSKVDSFTIVNYVGNCIPDCDLEITDFTVTDEMCGNTNGAIDITVFTSNSPYAAEWSSGAITEDISGLISGSYTVTLTDGEDCEVIQNFNVYNQSGTLAILGFNTTNEICGNSQGAIDMTVSGGALPYTYIWSNGASTQDLANIPAGTYNITVTDGNYCSVVSTASINNISGTLSYTWGNAVDEVCNNNEGSIDILINGGQLPYTYSWSNGATSEDLLHLSEGDYYCIVSDNNGCSITTPTFTVENDGGTLNIDNIDLDNEVCGNDQGEIEIDISGGITPYIFNWSTGSTTQNIGNLSAGTYSATITDQNGCQLETGNLTLINESGTLHLANIVTSDEICNNSQGAIDITVINGTPAYIYNWSNGSTSEDLSNIHAGSYSCTVTDQNGCQIFVNSTVHENMGTLSLLNTIITDENCGGTDGAIDLMISGGTAPILYSWNSGQTTEDINSLAAGNYSCTITDNQGCEIEANASIVNNTGSLSIVNQIISNETCGDNNGFIDLSIGGTATPFTYNWSNGATTQDINSLGSGTYTCTISDNLFCDLIAGPYTINSYSGSFIVSNIAVSDENCGTGNGSIDLTISGGIAPITYNWNTGATTEDLSSLSAGTYYYTVTDANCVISDSIVLANDAGTLAINDFTITDEVCSNGAGSIDVNIVGGSGPYIYNWNSSQTSEDISGLSSGNYIITVSDQNGCTIVSSAFSVNNDPGNFNLLGINVTDEQCGDGTGSIDVILSGGTNPIGYLWSNGGFVQDQSSLSAGVYSCTSTDGNGCVLTYSATVHNNPGNLQVNSDTIIDERCGNMDGEVDIEIQGGSTPYTFSWSNGANTEDIIGLNAGNYTCVISDASGCTTVYNGTVGDISGNFAISYVDYTDESCGNNNGAVNITVNGGITPYTYSWSNTASSEDITSLSAGYYSVTVTDQNGCADTASASLINTNGTLQIDNIVVSDENCGLGDGEIDLTYSGASSPSSVSWSNGDTDEDIEDLSEGWYYVYIIDALGCEAQDSAYVSNFTNGFSITSTIETNENCGDSAGNIDLTLSGGTTPYSYSWSTGDISEDLSNLAAGTYYCTISDSTGCNIYYEYEILNITNGLQLDNSVINDEYCYNLAGGIDISVSGGVGPYSYLWSNGDTTQDLSNITGGTYTLTITDASSCKIITQPYTVQSLVNNSLDFAYVNLTDESCGNGLGQIVFSPIGGTTYDYELNGNPIASTVISNLSAGTYTITINEFGCSTDTTVTISNITPFTAQVDSILNENCGDGNGGIFISVVPAGTYYFNWSNSVSTEDNQWISAGNYTCEVSDSTGCSTILSGNVINNTGFIVSSSVINDACGDSIGSIDLSVTGASGTVTYIWSNGATTEDISNLTAGTYSCTITDSTGCSFVETVNIQNQTSFAVSSSEDDDFCNFGQGQIILYISGGSGYFNILWNTGATSDTLSGLNAGSYSVTITDTVSGCSFTDSYTLYNNGYFTVNEIISHASCGVCADGAIDLTITGASTNYLFSWSNGATTEDINGLLPDSYTVTITDDWSCTDIQTYIVAFTTNIEGSDDDIFISLYPNPSNGIIYVDFDLGTYQDAEMILYNLLGDAILRKEISRAVATEILDLSGLQKGIYYLKIHNNYFERTMEIILE